MKQGSNYQNKKILVIGLGKSGASVAKLLVKLGANVTINDKQKPSDNQQIIGLEKLGIKVITGSHPLSLLDEQFELVVKKIQEFPMIIRLLPVLLSEKYLLLQMLKLQQRFLMGH